MPLERFEGELYPSRGWVVELEARDHHGNMRRQIIEAQSIDDVLLMTLEAYYSITAQPKVNVPIEAVHGILKDHVNARQPDQAPQVDDEDRDAEIHRNGVAQSRQPSEAPRPAVRPSLTLADREQRLRR